MCAEGTDTDVAVTALRDFCLRRGLASRCTRERGEPEEPG